MEKSNEHDKDGASPSEKDKLTDIVATALWENALRFACDLDQASARCKRRECAKAGGCAQKWTEGEPLDCGGGISPEVVKTAAGLALFASAMVIQFVAPVARRAHRRLDS